MQFICPRALGATLSRYALSHMPHCQALLSTPTPTPAPLTHTTQGLPARQWRDAVAIMTWVMTGLFAALFSVHLLRVCHKFCKRCGGRRRGESDKALSGSGGAARAAALELGKEVRARPYMTGGSSLQQQFGSTNNI